MANIYELMPRFQALFAGLDRAFGTGKGEWIKRPPRPEDWVKHLNGQGFGMGIAPLRPDNTVMFAAIDLDEPDFDAALAMMELLPGTSWLERSRSGNAHVWVFFRDPIEAWIPMAMLREATFAAGKRGVEVFPKNHDFSRVKLGNYINLPFHGESRPIIHGSHHGSVRVGDEFDPTGETLEVEWPLEVFITDAEATLNDPEEWRKRARWMLLEPPSSKERTSEFGNQNHLHMCAEHILDTVDTNPITPGHRAVVYFNLAKMLTNWNGVDHDEALSMLRGVNEASAPYSIPDSEIIRILGNAERGQFTSTGCDDPLFEPFAHPNCPIAHGG